MRGGTSPRRNVLLVDDEKNLTQTLSMLLETRGYEVDVAYSASEAFKKVSQKTDLIILDIVLPDLSGFRVCEKLKSDHETSHIPIIMLSAHSVHEDKLEGLYLGADDFLCKPCETEELFARMEAVMRRQNNGSQGKNGGNGVPGPNGKNGREGLISELRKILDEGLIVPFYQPIYLLDSLQLYGLEILSRPQSDTLLANPETFFRIALECGMYADIELMAWSMAMKPMKNLISTEMIFLNCNPYFIESSQFLRVKTLLQNNDMSPQNVIIEITERSAINNYALFHEHLAQYREQGFLVAVDDVGGGYSSLESIVEVKPDVVKIDRNIIIDLAINPFKQSMIKFISALCREHQILSVAEGIETKEDLELVKSLGIDAVQGYYLCRPTPHLNLAEFQRVLP